MKKLLLTAILKIIFISILMSQNYHPLVKENVYWDVLQGNSQNLYIYDGGARYFFSGDTLIGNHVYSKLLYYPFEIIYNPYPSFYVDTTVVNFQNYIREDTLTKKTYIIRSWNGANEELLFDFSLNIGDTLNSLYTTGGIPIIVDTITDVTLLNGAIRKKWLFDNGHFYIEGIGGDEGFFLPIFTGFGFWYETNCVNDNGVHLFGNQCFTILEIDKIDRPKSSLEIYPNPVKNTLVIERELSTSVDFKMYDLYGRLVLMKTLHSSIEEIDVSTLAKGIYVFDINGKESQRIIKK
jgi:hypothetical protein